MVTLFTKCKRCVVVAKTAKAKVPVLIGTNFQLETKWKVCVFDNTLLIGVNILLRKLS